MTSYLRKLGCLSGLTSCFMCGGIHECERLCEDLCRFVWKDNKYVVIHT